MWLWKGGKLLKKNYMSSSMTTNKSKILSFKNAERLIYPDRVCALNKSTSFHHLRFTKVKYLLIFSEGLSPWENFGPGQGAWFFRWQFNKLKTCNILQSMESTKYVIPCGQGL